MPFRVAAPGRSQLLGMGSIGKPQKQNALPEQAGRRVFLEGTLTRYGKTYCTVCTTLESGRALTAGTFRSLTSSASYSGKVSSFSLAFISTTL